MGLLDKKLLLTDLESLLNDYIPTNDVGKIIDRASGVLDSYNIEVVSRDGGTPDDSDNLIKLFLDAKVIEGRSAKTIEHYRYVLGRLREVTKVPLQKITVHHLRQYLMHEKDRGVSLRTLEGNRYVFTSFFGWAWKEELIPKNPTVNIAPIKQQKTIRKPFSDVDIERLNVAADNVRDRAIICFLKSTGCRVSEMCALNVDDVNFHEQVVIVLGKGNKQRAVYIDDVATMYLKQYLSERNSSEKALFLGKGGRLQPGGVRAMLRRIEDKSGVENVHPHRFRRTLATNLINHGMPIQEVAAVLGHDQLDTTMTYVYMDQKNVEISYRKYA